MRRSARRRGTSSAIAPQAHLAVEMEAAALYAFADATGHDVICSRT